MHNSPLFYESGKVGIGRWFFPVLGRNWVGGVKKNEEKMVVGKYTVSNMCKRFFPAPSPFSRPPAVARHGGWGERGAGKKEEGRVKKKRRGRRTAVPPHFACGVGDGIGRGKRKEGGGGARGG